MNIFGRKTHVLILAIMISLSVATLSISSEQAAVNFAEPADAVKIQEAVNKNGEAFIYFYSTEYEKSINEADRISALAKKEKAGFVKINIANKESASVARTYSLSYVPTVIHIKKDIGIIEQFAGPKKLKMLAENRKLRTNPYEKIISENSKKGNVTFLEFYADWCNPCMEQMPKLDEAEKSSNGKLKIIRLHVDEEPEMVALYNVDGPPTNIILDSSGVPRLRTGAVSSPETVRALLNRLGII